jgi:thioredoxin 1
VKLSLVESIESSSIEEQIKNKSYEKLVIAIFYTTWCIPSKNIINIFNEISEEFSNNFHISIIDIDKHYKIIKKLSIRSVPDIKIYDKGEVVEEFMGLRDKEEIIEMVSKYINSKSNEMINSIKALMSVDVESAYELANRYKDRLINNNNFKFLYAKILLKKDKKDEALDLLLSFQKSDKNYTSAQRLLTLNYNLEQHLEIEEVEWMYSSVLEYVGNGEINRAVMLLINILQKREHKNSKKLLKHITTQYPLPPSLSFTLKEIL